MKFKFRMIILLSIILTNLCFASKEVTQISRYLTIKNKPKQEQTDLLSQIVQIRFPQNVQTVGSAIGYLLRFSGYSLIEDNRMNRALQITLTKPLPIVDRELGPVSLKIALTTLVGQSFNMVYDPVNREIDFQLKPEFQKYVKRG